ncbi:MAG: type II secretion system minor pseudopilin GspI [Gammaproteobacteria bacterium]|uniref:type II secretion system minor pseudopilin GspI n=1 Tax=Rhodoferax sp. TaxID=50421 RepID=UPI0017BE39E7|nr:type II secretion system minor pseudopilin GspI [Rhodoferax sp.]MBU3900476.1 type II secretion system minor pseudopilin GspI [Gammaproteobacteria bacterium]MBA3059943.1 type II secretion system protein GspI [Rhodoferax sp.]MBU3997120.1 type II secretion system minor pseudopilin GspI [Gammaproteobacteria bacterium]MBU4079921.1 type II secretion system minor pseudopilin GspI [Gammaproteobacteria bacterium]MBU4112936.1 type II secretion system minor pseudopilin GspI [Gammaproteobacteria bacter
MHRITPARRLARGFTLVEVLVALGIVAIALLAGLQATAALTRHAQRQSDMLLGQTCAENELIRLRLARQLPDVGDSSVVCEQAGEVFTVALAVRPTPNFNFRRVDAQVFKGDESVLRLSTIAGRY